MRRRCITRCCSLLIACAAGLLPHPTGVRVRLGPRHASDDGCAEAVEGDVVIFTFPATVDPPGSPGDRRLGVVKAEMSCTAWIQPLVRTGRRPRGRRSDVGGGRGLRRAGPMPGRHRVRYRRRVLWPTASPVFGRRRRVRGHGRRVLDFGPGPGARGRRGSRVGLRGRAVDALVYVKLLKRASSHLEYLAYLAYFLFYSALDVRRCKTGSGAGFLDGFCDAILGWADASSSL